MRGKADVQVVSGQLWLFKGNKGCQVGQSEVNEGNWHGDCFGRSRQNSTGSGRVAGGVSLSVKT